MYTKAGDRACHSLVSKAVKRINGKLKVTKEELDELLSKGVDRIAVKHGEVNDTEPEGHIAERVNQALKNNGYGFELSRFDW